MSLLESAGGVTSVFTNSVDFTSLVPLNSTMAGEGYTSFPGEAEARGTAAGTESTLSTAGATPPWGYPRKASLLWTLILSTSISSVDPEAASKLTHDESPSPGTPQSLHQVRSGVNNSASVGNFGTSLKLSKIDALLRGISKKTSDVLDPGTATTGVSVDHEQGGGSEGMGQARSFATTTGTLVPDEGLSQWNGMREDEIVTVSKSLSVHIGNTDVALQPDEGQLMEGFSSSAAAPLATSAVPPEPVTSDVVTAVLGLHDDSSRTTAGEPETFSAFPPPSATVLMTTTDSAQDSTPSDQTSGDTSKVATTSMTQSSSVVIQHIATPSKNEEQNSELADPAPNFNEFSASLLAQNNSNLAEVSSISINSLYNVLPESGITHREISELSVPTEVTEPGNFETSMPGLLDSTFETVEPLPTSHTILDLDETSKPFIAVAQPFENLLSSTRLWEIADPEPSPVDTVLPESIDQDVMIPEPLGVDVGLPEPQNPPLMSPKSQNETITPVFHISDIAPQQTEELGVPKPERNNEAAPDVPTFHITQVFQNVSERSAGNWSNDTLNATLDGKIHWSVSRILLLVIQLLIMVETVLGNLVVILSVKVEKKLQTPFNYYIVNLAFTDMNVGISVMSLFMVYNLYDYFPFGSFLCDYWIWSDYTMTFESVMTLAAISLDRLWSVTWSLHYRNHNSGRKSVCIILATWCLVALIWLPPFIYDRVTNTYSHGDCYWDTVLNKNLVVYVGCLGYYSPLLVMLGAYARILWVVRKRATSIRDAGRKLSIGQPTESSESCTAGTSGGREHSLVPPPQAPARDDRQVAKLRREMKAVYTLLNIVVIFLICWVPFYTLFVLSAWYPTLFPTWYVTFSYWMAYINSALNPILYPLSSHEFRAAYKQVLHTFMCKK